MILAGEYALWIALLCFAGSAALSFAGGHLRRDDLAAAGARGFHTGAAFLLVAALGLWTALLTRDFSLRYVATFTSANLPLPYRMSAFWAGRAGSTLLMGLLLALCAALATWTSHGRRYRESMSWVTGTCAAVLLVVVAAAATSANPFVRLDSVAPDGRGLDPQLQSLAMALHRPILFLGYAASTVAFAFAVGTLATRRADDGWLRVARRWMLASWVILTAAIALGLWWSYVEPGRVSRWPWHPVENGSLLPWLAVTAFLHGTETPGPRGTSRMWNVALITATFLLSTFGVLIARSGTLLTLPAVLWTPRGAWVAGAAIVSFALVLYALGGIRPWVTSAARRIGGRMVHLGTLLVVAAFVGTTFREGHDVTLADGGTVTTADAFGRSWLFSSDGLSRYRALNRDVETIALRANLDGRSPHPLISESRQFVDARGTPTYEPSTRVGILHSPLQDVYLVLKDASGGRAAVRIEFVPFAIWIWVGFGLMLVGGLVVLWSRSERRTSEESISMQNEPDVETTMESADDLAERLIARVKSRATTCPAHGPRPEPDALFCSDCGRYLAVACLRCGAAVDEEQARFCTECGHSLAA